MALRHCERERSNPIVQIVMPALVAGIHVLLIIPRNKDVDGRVKPGHDDGESFAYAPADKEKAV